MKVQSILKSYLVKIKLNNHWSSEGRPIDTDLKRQAIELQKSLEWEDAGPERAALLSGTDTGNILYFKFLCVKCLLLILSQKIYIGAF